jgi:hypothetical protein
MNKIFQRNVKKCINILRFRKLSISLQIYSDIHLEFYKSALKMKKYSDYLVLAGDIGKIGCKNYDYFLKYVSTIWKHVIYVPGNHEYYNDIYNINELKNMYKDLMKKYDNIHYLDDSHWDHNGYRFIGSTLWSNPSSEITGLCDFREIKENNNENLSIDTFKELHMKSIEYIKKILNETNTLTPILITHFPPIRDNTCHPKYIGSKYTSYFTNELIELDIPKKDLSKITMWISGHTHYSYDIRLDFIDNCRFISNQLGYPGEYNEANAFTDEKSVYLLNHIS